MRGVRGKTKYPPDGHFTSIKRPSSLLITQEVKLHPPIETRKISRRVEEGISAQYKYIESQVLLRIKQRNGVLE